ncbi:C4-dicarboxylate TRAP transporter large permease protein DctM [Sinobacterium norvegicum]|uniref:TRAP transporter large permease protein n=1 Tax=Sinobacterium norvegicum TaxID=1641715 RepID=A0ABM9AIR2_9GAMM|nr:TRAP transporter large permease subunit [Sinobacterium norvegicum]CAH0993116.1 C4-dicarboxylate TRAP transporter large permease protein DctM [Sinobacterium norvegicum]
MIELMPLFLFAFICGVLLLGYPVAFSLGGASLLFAAIGIAGGIFDASFLAAVPNRIFGTMSNNTLIAVPLFILMGVMLQRSKIAEELLTAMAAGLGNKPGGLAIAVIIVGMLLAASTGIVGATVVTMGLLSLPTMLSRGYSASFATGTICATGTLGQIIPPSIALVLLGDILSTGYQQAQINLGNYSPDTVSVGDLFVGAIVPGLLLVVFYIIYVVIFSQLKPDQAGGTMTEQSDTGNEVTISMATVVAPILLIVVVLGSILAGAATPTEAAGIGALGASLLAFYKKQLDIIRLQQVAAETLKITSMVFMILIGAAIFSLVFRGYGGDELITDYFASLEGGVFSAVLIVMLVIFFLGFILDFIEITFVVVPIVGPILFAMGVDPIWLGIMIALNLQTSFLTPPFGFALFYLRGVAPEQVATTDIYRGVAPFIVIQLLLLALIAYWPALATWLPSVVYG